MSMAVEPCARCPWCCCCWQWHCSHDLRRGLLLVRTADGKGRKAAIEVMINTPSLAEKIREGDFHEIKALMSKSRELGMMTFDDALLDQLDP